MAQYSIGPDGAQGIKKLGFGLMRLPKAGEAIDVEQTKRMVDLFMDAGFTYFDTAWAYAGSEEAIAQALVQRYPRESFQLATKAAPWISCESRDDAITQLETSLKKTGAGYFDFYLLHNLGEFRTHFFDDWGMWDWILEKKREGVIRHAGFSFHSTPEELDELLTSHPEMEFVQLQINYADWDNPAVQSRRCHEVARKHNKPVIIMEPARGGMLVNLADRVAAPLVACSPEKSLASWAYRFCYNLPGVLTVLSGMSTIDQVRQNIADFKANEPFSPAETEALAQTREILESIAAIPCTNCRYCVKGCPQEVAIPEIMGLLNLEAQVENNKFVSDLYSWQAKPGRASDCIECGLCESMCPQQIGIIENLKTAVEHFE